jgi:hypothetical protein
MKWYDDLPHVWQEVIDQTLHFGAGFLIGCFSPILSIVVAVAYEAVQNWGDEDNNYLDLATDLLVWTLGAVVASLAF